jgi:hypothetical protein
MALAAAVAAIIVLSAVVISQTRNDAYSDTSATLQTASNEPMPQPNTASPPAAGAQMKCEGYTANVDANSQPGWHATVNRLGLAYAAPPDWAISSCGVRMGWAKPCPEGQCVIREIGAVSSVANPVCPKQNLAMAGVARSNDPEIRAALDEESRTVSPIYTRGQTVPNVEFGQVRDFIIGTQPAVQLVATVTGIATDSCHGPSALHSIVVTTMPNIEGSVVFLISLREGANAKPKPEVIGKIVDTLRSPA